MKRLAYLSLLLAMLAACGKTPDKVVNVESGATPDQQALLQDATKQLITACTGLNQWGYDLVKNTWTASVANNGGNPFNYRTQKWGWSKWIEITVQVSPKAKDLPSEWNAPGKLLTYDLGSAKATDSAAKLGEGAHTGIATRDKLSQLMCSSMAVSNDPNNPDVFLAWPDLSSLDKLQ
jgi:hypothetical protein